MSNQVYEWKRFWCPRSGSINLADRGYLCDPDTEWGKVYNPDLVNLEAIADVPCLILLGEPGIGKSQEMENLKVFTEDKIDDDYPSLELNLRSCTNLKDDLFKDETFIDWLGSTHHLYLFLDSLDEGLLSIPTLSVGLIDELKKKKYRDHISRLHLCLACRTFVFPAILEEGLKELWQENNFKIYELAPLRRVDVIEAAKAEGFSSDNFLKEVEQKNVVPLAIKPVTLGFLLNTYRRHNEQFPPNQKLHELYLEGCKLLCEEVNENRRGSNRKGNLDSDQRLIVAARIAAITIFANRFAVWTGIDQGDIPNEDVLLQKLCEGHETAHAREFEITRAAIEEVLDTGLFSSRGLHRMGWAHQTYAEFLAAWYLVHHDIPLAQITELIFSSEDLDQKLIPQLHETAVWLTSMREGVLQKIIKTDPDVLLQSDVPTDASVRSAIVDNLLTQYEEEKIFDRDIGNYHNYAKLMHLGLADQLRPYICDPSKQIDARELAINIAEVCELDKLQDDLVDIVLYSSEDIYLRISAARTISKIGNRSSRLKLKPLAVAHLVEDDRDDLKGYCIKAVWQICLNAQELFASLAVPKRNNYLGSYKYFLNHELAESLKVDELVIALHWLSQQDLKQFCYPLERLADQILYKAWNNFEHLEIARQFAEIAILKWNQCQPIITIDNKLKEQFQDELLNGKEKRHQLIKIVVSLVTLSEQEPPFLLSSLTETVLIKEDISWMLNNLQSSDCVQKKEVWSQLIQWIFYLHDIQDENEVDEILTAAQADKILWKSLESYLNPIELGSIQAERLKDSYLRNQKLRDRGQNLSLLNPPPKEQVLQLLEELESGDLSAWCRLNMEMTLEPDSKYYRDQFESDLTKLPGWQEAEEVTQKRIIEGAKNYIQKQGDISYEWIGTNTYDRPALAGCRAFELLQKESSGFLEILSSEIWKKWAPAIIAKPSSSQHGDFYLEIVKRTYLNAPQESINTLITLIDKDNQEHDYIFVINRFEKCWDERLNLALLEKAKDPTLKPECVGQLLEELLKQGATEARDFATSLISFPLPLAKNEREKALIASRVLIENSDAFSWSFIWSLIQQDPSFGREVLELAASRYSHGIQLHLTETQLADLYFWLVQQYPYDEDPNYSNDGLAHFVTAREDMANLRDHVLIQLKERGTLQACAEIKYLIQKLPSLTWLRKTLIDAQANMRRKTWQPPQPEQILQLVSSQQEKQSTNIQAGVLIMQGSNNPNLNFSGSVGAVNLNSTVHGDQIGTQHHYASEQNLVEAFDEIQQIFNRLTQTCPTSTESEQQIVVAKAVNEVKQNPTLMKRVKVGGQAFIFEALQKASDQWWVSPFVKALEAGIKGE